MMDDLVQRLRKRLQFYSQDGARWYQSYGNDTDCNEAADEIERLRAELSAEKAEVFRVQCEYSALHHKWAELLVMRDALRATADCRLCANFTTKSGGCVSVFQCVDGSQYKATPPRQYWLAGTTGGET